MLLGGLALLGGLMMAGRLRTGGSRGLRAGAEFFIPIWLAVATVELSLVSDQGQTAVSEQFWMLLLGFLVPASVATAIALWLRQDP